MKKTLLTVAIVLGLSACAGGAAESQYNELVLQAENEIKIATQMNALWKDTEKFLKASKAAKEAGNMDKAMKLAKKALKQAQLAQAQAKANANVKPVY